MTEPRSEWITMPDGIRLHARIHGCGRAERLPVVCLPGLSRNEKDFTPLAQALAADPARPRRVIALDLRGRGRSDRDRNPENYTPPVELLDVLSAMTALSAAPAIVVGTSRGGILAMLMAAARPGALAGAVLNDIGPVIERAGLMRIRSYLGRQPPPQDHAAGAASLRRLFAPQFPRLTDDDWMAWSRRTWSEGADGTLAPGYDPALAQTLSAFGPQTPIPALWGAFDAMAGCPVLAIRGALSDILSADTLAAMKARRPDLETYEVADQGHAPLLDDPAAIAAVAAFAARCDDRRRQTAG